jgi:hypothetical protein
MPSEDKAMVGPLMVRFLIPKPPPFFMGRIYKHVVDRLGFSFLRLLACDLGDR